MKGREAKTSLYGLVFALVCSCICTRQAPLQALIIDADAGARVACDVNLDSPKDLCALLAAGIPLRMRIAAESNGKRFFRSVRTLTTAVCDCVYVLTDSIQGRADSVEVVRHAFTGGDALAQFSVFDIPLDRSSTGCRITVELLPSNARALNRSVDISVLGGFRQSELWVAIDTGQRAGQRGARGWQLAERRDR